MDPKLHVYWPRNMSEPRRSSRKTAGSTDNGSTTARVLKKSVGLKPSATPLFRLIRPTSRKAPPSGCQLKYNSRKSTRMFSCVANGISSPALRPARALKWTLKSRRGIHSRSASAKRRASMVGGLGDGRGTSRLDRNSAVSVALSTYSLRWSCPSRDSPGGAAGGGFGSSAGMRLSSSSGLGGDWAPAADAHRRASTSAHARKAIVSFRLQARKVLALEPGLRDICRLVPARLDGRYPRAVDGVEYDSFGGPLFSQGVLEATVEQDFQEPTAVRIELRLDGAECLLFHPVFDAGIRGKVVGRLQVQVPGLASLAVRVLDRLGRHQGRDVVDGHGDGEHVADGCLADEPLLGRDAHARFGGRVVEPESAPVEKHGLASVARRLDIPDKVAELVGARILLREDGKDVLRLGLAGDVLGQSRDESKRLVRIPNLICAHDDL